MKKTLISLAILAALVGLSGCQRGIEPKAQAASVAVEQQAVKDLKERHYCAGITKVGVRCRKPVKAEGGYCWIHANQDKRVKK